MQRMNCGYTNQDLSKGLCRLIEAFKNNKGHTFTSKKLYYYSSYCRTTIKVELFLIRDHPIYEIDNS